MNPPVQEQDNPVNSDDVRRMLDTLVTNELGYAMGAAQGRTEQVQFAFAIKYVVPGESADGQQVDYGYSPHGSRGERVANDAVLAAALNKSVDDDPNDEFADAREQTSVHEVALKNGQRVVLGLFADTKERVRVWGLTRLLEPLVWTLNDNVAAADEPADPEGVTIAGG